MPHDKSFPQRAQLGRGLQPIESEFHDVLVIPPRRKSGKAVLEPEQFFRFPVIKKDAERSPVKPPGATARKAERKSKAATAAGTRSSNTQRTKRTDPPQPPGTLTGRYLDPPELWDRNDVGQRKVLGIARPNQAEAHSAIEELRGPAFAVMAVKPEPGSSSCAWCYLVNAENFLAPNAWTAEEWNAPGGPDLPAGPHANDREAEVLLALPRGIVVRFRASNLHRLDAVLANPAAKPEQVRAKANGVTYQLEPVRLNNESEIWSQLRNGCIAGRVLHRQTERVVPIVNVTSLMAPVEPAQKGNQR